MKGMGRRKSFIGAAVIMLFMSVMSSAATRTTIIYVTGMTCGGCAISIEQVLKNTEGVEDVRVNFERGEAVVKYDARKVTATKLRAVVKSIGFRASAKPSKNLRGLKAKDSVCCNSGPAIHSPQVRDCSLDGTHQTRAHGVRKR